MVMFLPPGPSGDQLAYVRAGRNAGGALAVAAITAKHIAHTYGTRPGRICLPGLIRAQPSRPRAGASPGRRFPDAPLSGFTQELDPISQYF
jgi:hypothetical protein